MEATAIEPRTMPIKLYDLAGADPARRFSPYCWRTHMALKHKHLEFETIPWRFTDKEVIAFSGQGMVPVIVDEETTVADSWAIAEYLEEAYPGQPSLFDGAAGKREARFLKHWTETILNAPVSRMIILDIYNRVDPKDQAYFRASREKRFGKPLEEVVADRETVRAEFQKSLAPMRNVLKEQPFLSGESASYGDYVVFGTFAWARNTSSFELVPADDPVAVWRDRMLGLFDGYAASFPAA
jgi:glutathione S-transferase